MLRCQELPRLSEQKSRNRLASANNVLGPALVSRVVGFALYLLGASRRALAEITGLRPDALKALVSRVLSDGLPALEDRRRRLPTAFPAPALVRPQPRVQVRDETVVIELDEHQKIEILRKNRLQCRTVLLTFLEANLLGIDQVADALNLSKVRVRSLRAVLQNEGVPGLMDQRKGRREYRVTPGVKAEIIQQFMLNLATNVSTSSARLQEDLDERCQIQLGPRTIRLHLERLGLRGIGKSLRELLADAKKN